MSDNEEKQKQHFIDWTKKKKVPKPTEIKNSGELNYIKWGADNMYPHFLNTLREESATHGGIIDKKVFFMTSGGYTIKLAVESEANKAIIKDLEDNNRSDYNLRDILTYNVEDLEVFNGFCFKGEWDFMRGIPAFLEPLDFDAIRTNENGTRFFYSDDWGQSKQTLETTGFKEIPLIDLKNRIGEFIVYFKIYPKKTEKGMRIYPVPKYSGGIRAIMTDIEIDNFQLFEALNSYKTGTIISIPSSRSKTKEDKELLANKIKEGATSRESAGGIMVLFGEGGTEHVKVENLNGSDLPDRYDQADTRTQKKILKAHSAGPAGLFDMTTAGQLGTNDELKEGFEIFNDTYVSARQKFINDVWQWFITAAYKVNCSFSLNLADNPFTASVKDADPASKTVNRLNRLGDKIADKVLSKMTDNEIRALGLLAPLPGGDELPSEGSTGPTFKLIQIREEEFGPKDPILKLFEGVGRKKTGYIIKESREVPIERADDWFETNERELMETIQNERHFFATILTETQKNILSLIDSGEDVRSISSALNKSIQEIMNEYTKLVSKGLIKKNNTLSQQGKRYLEVTEIPIEDFEIRYSYELRPGAPRLRSESRPFCRKLLELDKLYTRDEINSIHNAIGRDVWSYRGGWYTIPKGEPNEGQHTPYCRHIWQQNIVVKKKK